MEISTKKLNGFALGEKALLKEQQDKNERNPNALRITAQRREQKWVGF